MNLIVGVYALSYTIKHLSATQVIFCNVCLDYLVEQEMRDTLSLKVRMIKRRVLCVRFSLCWLLVADNEALFMDVTTVLSSR